ncbi:DJ-1/PfpI family protein [Actinoplanes sp. NPDC024001]|uniref:DJ-1/PfpI family protein n=1 Tax=Actinoplanes sp. NPDC024001 TaxID=3154598 RepID=UPI0033C01B7A
MARTVRGLLTALLTVGIFAGICAAGVAVSMRQSFPAAAAGHPAGWPAPRKIPPGRLVVAVALGASGSVVADALLPYEVFARSGRFAVHTVAHRRTPLPLSGGLHVVPEHTFDSGPAPDVIVVPAVVDPSEAPLLDWISRQARRGARVLGVCAGSHVLARSGVLDGRRATEFWANVDARRRAFPAVRWLRGQRYVEDGPVTTTAGVTSGVVGALRVVERLAGPGEAARIGRDLAYPGWAPGGATAIPVHRIGPGDLPYALNAAFPWGRPTVGVRLTDGVGESEVAAAFEVHSATSFATRTVPLTAGRTVTTRHGMLLTAGDARVNRIVEPGGDGFPFDRALLDLAEHTDRATARTTAKFTEYPGGHLAYPGPLWPWRPTALAVAALLLSAALALAVIRIARRLARAAAGRRSG